MSNLFDDLEMASADGLKQPIRPLSTVNLQSEEAVKNWLKNAYNVLMEYNKPRFEESRENMRMYKGALLQKSKSSLNQRTLNEQDTLNLRIKDQKLYVNLLYDVTEQRVSKLMRFKPAVSILPANGEYEDRIAANVAKAILDTIWYENNIDKHLRDLERAAAICGEAYLSVLWNADKGDLHPDYVKMRDRGEEISIEQQEGDPIKINSPIRIGDVDYQVLLPWRVLNERRDSYDKVDWQITIWYEDVDELKSRFPEKAQKIKVVETELPGYEDYQLRELKDANKTIVFKLYHKPTRLMPKGAFIYATYDCILSIADYPFNFDCLPLIRLTDIDVPGDLDGVSFYRNVKGLQFQHYNLSSMIIANQRLMAYPKWMVPQGSVNVMSLGNDRTVVQYRGPQPPVLVQGSPTSAEVFNFREVLKEEIRQLSGSTPQDRGEPPPGITAAVALQFLAEQEAERFNTAIAKHNDVIKYAARLTIAIAGDYYDPSDERMIRVLGKDSQYEARFFDVANLSRPYDVRIANASALPETKSAKIQTIVDLNDKFPGLFSKEQVLDFLEIANVDQFNKVATAAVRAAESLYEDLVQGRPVQPPQMYEDLIQHWRVFTGLIQDRAFKEQVPEDRRINVLEYLAAVEMLMIEKAGQNALFGAMVKELPLFPVAFVMPVPAPVQPLPEEEMAMAGAQMTPEGPVPPAAGAEALPPEQVPPAPSDLRPEQIAMDPNIQPSGLPRAIE